MPTDSDLIFNALQSQGIRSRSFMIHSVTESITNNKTTEEPAIGDSEDEKRIRKANIALVLEPVV